MKKNENKESGTKVPLQKNASSNRWLKPTAIEISKKTEVEMSHNYIQTQVLMIMIKDIGL